MPSLTLSIRVSISIPACLLCQCHINRSRCLVRKESTSHYNTGASSEKTNLIQGLVNLPDVESIWRVFLKRWSSPGPAFQDCTVEQTGQMVSSCSKFCFVASQARTALADVIYRSGCRLFKWTEKSLSAEPDPPHLPKALLMLALLATQTQRGAGADADCRFSFPWSVDCQSWFGLEF